MDIDDMIEEVRPIHNDICILYDSELVRVVGVAEDEADLYYIVRRTNGPGKNEFWASAVGGIISLNGLYPEDRYVYLDSSLEMNGAPPSEEFIVSIPS